MGVRIWALTCVAPAGCVWNNSQADPAVTELPDLKPVQSAAPAQSLCKDTAPPPLLAISVLAATGRSVACVMIDPARASEKANTAIT